MASINYSAKTLTVDDIDKAIRELNDLKKIKERESREAVEKLPSDARRKVLVGVAFLAARKQGFITEDFLYEVLDKFLTKIKDRAVFNLTPREAEADPQRGRPKKETKKTAEESREPIAEPAPIVAEADDRELATVATTTDETPAPPPATTASKKSSGKQKEKNAWDKI